MPFIGIIQVAFYVLLAILFFPSLLTKKTIISLILFAGVNFFFYLRGNEFYSGINTVIVPFLVMLSGLLISEYAIKYDKDYKFTKLVFTTVIAANVFMAVISIPQLMFAPNIIRGAELNNSTDESMRTVYAWVMSYGTVHGIPLLMAPLTFLCLYLYRNGKRYKKWSFITLLLLYVVFRSNATTAFILSVFLILTSVFLNAEEFNEKLLNKLAVTLALLFIFGQPEVIVTSLDVAQETMDERGSNYKKIDELEDELMYGDSDGDWRKRVELYETSSTLFMESPLFGTKTPEMISRHTWIVDRLALFGLVFSIPIVMLFYYYFRQMYSNLIHTKVTFAYGFIGLMFMLYMKNDFGQGTWLYGFAFLPLMCRYVDYMIDYKLKRTNPNIYI
jgi:hypothetical protein